MFPDLFFSILQKLAVNFVGIIFHSSIRISFLYQPVNGLSYKIKMSSFEFCSGIHNSGKSFRYFPRLPLFKISPWYIKHPPPVWANL
ncbi:hypothetical protein CS542_01745 [Pedobacter sp. IW39]|nr:hypothetical protein CS542_01745 [Pedobacter sp. IW39]